MSHYLGRGDKYSKKETLVHLCACWPESNIGRTVGALSTVRMPTGHFWVRDVSQLGFCHLETRLLWIDIRFVQCTMVPYLKVHHLHCKSVLPSLRADRDDSDSCSWDTVLNTRGELILIKNHTSTKVQACTCSLTAHPQAPADPLPHSDTNLRCPVQMRLTLCARPSADCKPDKSHLRRNGECGRYTADNRVLRKGCCVSLGTLECTSGQTGGEMVETHFPVSTSPRSYCDISV